MYQILETKDYKGLTEMFFRYGLEVSPDEEPPQDLVKCWEVVKIQNGERVAGLKLEIRDSVYVIGAIAVEQAYRHNNIGTLLVNKAIEEVQLLGEDSVYLIAKVPNFFKQLGFATIEFKSAPNIAKCLSCKQYNIDCFPEIMRLKI
jgi:N-acetylglutamate synthase-like GNAT family acetyltransferase